MIREEAQQISKSQIIKDSAHHVMEFGLYLGGVS